MRKFYLEGGVSGAVYNADDNHWDLIGKVMRMYIVSNPLHATEFAPVTQMEAEILRMCVKLYKGNSESCGLLTSGGTESIILSVLSYREQAKAERGVKHPNIVISHTVHAAFAKACYYFNIEYREVHQTSDCKFNLQGVSKLIDSNTICLVASAPDYAFGNFDPVPEIAALALKHGIGCHVDSCLGSFVNLFAERAGFRLPCKFDFTVPGVTTISSDPHKYGYAPKGVSVALFKNPELRNYSFFNITTWTGGMYGTPTIAGSRPGNVIAGTWAAMMSIGQEQYVTNSRKILSACHNTKKELAKMSNI